jgi:hypothetical protein
LVEWKSGRQSLRRAACGHAAAPPASEMKSRRLNPPLKSNGQAYHIVGRPKRRCAAQ